MNKCYYCPQRFDSADERDDHMVAGHRDAPINDDSFVYSIRAQKVA